MFTGIVSDIGTVVSAERQGDLRLMIASAYDMAGVDLGASIACSGVCLTVVDKTVDWFAVDVSAETESRTAQELWTAGAKLNLERALRLGDELGGHIVTGHVDGVADVLGTSRDGASIRIDLSIPKELARYCAQKGSITLDGVSLTINDVRQKTDGAIDASVNIIPHTARHTTLGEHKVGGQLNVEIDVMARYIERIMATRSQQ